MATLALSASNATGTSVLQLGRLLTALGAEQVGDKALDGTITITDSPLSITVTGRTNTNANVTIKP